MWLRKVKHSGSGLSSGAVPRTEGLRGDVWPRAESPEAAGSHCGEISLASGVHCRSTARHLVAWFRGRG